MSQKVPRVWISFMSAALGEELYRLEVFVAISQSRKGVARIRIEASGLVPQFTDDGLVPIRLPHLFVPCPRKHERLVH
jgi:hypothetical protein